METGKDLIFAGLQASNHCLVHDADAGGDRQVGYKLNKLAKDFSSNERCQKGV